MGKSIERTGALFIGPSAAWGQAAAGLTYLRAGKVKLPAGRTINPSEYDGQLDLVDRPYVLREPGTVEFETGVFPAQSAWPTGDPSAWDPATGNPTNLLLSAFLGDVHEQVYLGATTGVSTATVLAFDAYEAAIANLEIGAPIFVRAADADSVLGANCVQSVDYAAGTVTLRSPLPSAPAVGSLVYGCYWNALCPKSTVQDFEITRLGSGNYNRQQNLGCAVSKCVILAPFRKQAMMQMAFLAANPIPPAAAESGGEPTVQTWAWGEAVEVLCGGIYLWDGVTNHKIQGGIELDFGINLVENPGIHGVDPNGVDSFTLEKRQPVAKIQPNYLSNDLFTLADTQPTTLVLTAWFGRGARCVMFQFPGAIVQKWPEYTGRDGVVDLSIEIGASGYTGDTGDAGADDAVDKGMVFGVLAGEVVA
jgi:hypothetical protein